MSGNDEPHRVPKQARKAKGHKKAIASTSSTTIMDPSLWKTFPEELHECVMARAPMASLFRFRAVCRDWYSILTSRSFSELYAQVKESKPWVYSTINLPSNDGAIYDPESNKWYRTPFPFPFPPTNLPVEPVASAGGLVCLVDGKCMTAYVGNPLTGSFKELPPWSIHYGAIAMTANEDDSWYQILLVSPNGTYEIYDSTINCWDEVEVLPPNIKRPLGFNIKSRVVSIDGMHYFLRSNPNGIVYYNVTSRVWKEMQIPSPPFLDDHTLADCGGKIMLVGLVRFGTPYINVWELQNEYMLWKLVCRMPFGWAWEFQGKLFELDFLSNKDSLMICMRSKDMYRLVMYDISTKKWSRPPCKIPSYGRKRPWIVNGTTFHPRLIASNSI